jgi:hypothetical protein
MPRPTFDAANSSTYAVSVTVGTATMAFASMVEVGSAPPDDLTWGGNTMTSIVTGSRGTRFARLGRYNPPGSGAQAVSTNDPNAASCIQRCGMTLLDVDTTTPIATSGTSNDSTASVSIPVGTVTADQIVVWALHTNTNGTETVSAGANTTVRAQSNTPDNNPVAIGTATGDINLTWSVAREWVLVWAVVNGTPSGPTATPALGRYRVIGGGR